MLLKTGPTLACGLSLAAAFFLTSPAHAVLCKDLSATDFPNPIYGVGGSAVTATLGRIQQAINKDPNKTNERVTIFWHDALGACAGFQAYLSGKVTGQFQYWDTAVIGDKAKTCDADIGGQAVTFSHMGNDPTFCPDPNVPAGVGDFIAPIQTLNLITDAKSNQLSISAEALYFIYGFGATGQAAPWTEGTGIYQRQFDSFASLLLAAAIKVPSASFAWKNANEKATQSDVIKAITAYVGGVGVVDELKASQSLGYVSGSAADKARTATATTNPMRTLAYQHYDQTCGVYPDSEPNKFDKLNVREGKYYLWAAGHYFTKVDSKGKPLDAKIENLIGWFNNKTQPPGTTVSAFEQSILAGDIPQCAMHASREGTIGAISSYADPKPCGCYFEHTTNSAVTSACTPCTTDAQCGGDTPACNFGYCEAYRAAGEVEG